MATKSNQASLNPLELYTKNQVFSIYTANMWSRPATALMIELYKSFECLWKTTSVYYRNKKKRHEALQEIATTITPFRANTTVEDVKNKINGIRTQYAAEKNKVLFYAKKNPRLTYEPSLWCYDRLSFLAPYTSLKNKSLEGNAMNLIPNSEEVEIARNGIPIKIEDDNDEGEFTESHDLNKNEEGEEYDSPLKPVQYLDVGSCPKRLFSDEFCEEYDNAKEIISRAPKLPKIIQIASSKQKTSSYVHSHDLEDDASSIVPQAEESLVCTENEDRIEVFGKFVSTQMKLITDKTLLIQLQHTIQSAIMETQLKQIELDKK